MCNALFENGDLEVVEPSKLELSHVSAHPRRHVRSAVSNLTWPLKSVGARTADPERANGIGLIGDLVPRIDAAAVKQEEHVAFASILMIQVGANQARPVDLHRYVGVGAPADQVREQRRLILDSPFGQDDDSRSTGT